MAGASRGLIAALDIGSSKICCLIAESRPGGGLEVIGAGHQSAAGIKAGAIVHMDSAEQAIAAAIQEAEDTAGERIRQAYIACSAGQPQTETVSVSYTAHSREIISADLRRLLALAKPTRQDDTIARDVLHKIPLSWRLDGVDGIVDPRGMHGDTLSAEVLIVSAAASPVRTLAGCVRRSHVALAGIVVTPYAAGLGCLTPEEQSGHVVVIDLGCGTTGASVFVEGQLRFVSILPVGGRHVTADIAHGLGIPVQEAERYKTLRGVAASGVLDLMAVAGNSAALSLPRARHALPEIIRSRLEETFELVKQRLEVAPLPPSFAPRFVLTGGGSQLPGLSDVVARTLGGQVQLAKPTPFPGLPPDCHGPAFAACLGLLRYAALQQVWSPEHDRIHTRNDRSRWRKTFNWLRDNF
jgi:cell division protein FtsA